MTIDILLGVIALAAVVLTLFLVPALIQLKNTAAQVEQFLDSTSRELGPLLVELKSTTDRLNSLAADIETKAAKVDVAFNAAEHVGYTVEGFNILLKEKVDTLSSSVIVLSAGLQGALQHVIGRFLKREQKDIPKGPHYY
ncbi:MAG: DUF948 domain-containing protein [Nitrospirota bacterium]|nr:DUF948 domain-containing protein [Nitrospirota bacterium]